MSEYLDDTRLERSSIVANNRMNRERQATGTNGYETDLGLNPIEFVYDRLSASGQMPPRWLDLCCGRGRAICEAVEALANVPGIEESYFLGVDLVGMFDALPADCSHAELIEASLHDWNTSLKFDLITCSHGLHYVGDKLGLLQRAASWLRPNGLLVANLDSQNLKLIDSRATITRRLRESGFDYCKKTRLVRFHNNAECGTIDFRVTYLGADDQAGPNYTGQEAVNSYYRSSGE